MAWLLANVPWKLDEKNDFSNMGTFFVIQINLFERKKIGQVHELAHFKLTSA